MTRDELLHARIQFSRMIALLVLYGLSKDISVLITWVQRDKETQKKLVADGKSKTQKSKHLRGLAVDLLIVDDNGVVHDGEDQRYTILGTYWENCGGKWGGRWKTLKDSGHFEWSV